MDFLLSLGLNINQGIIFLFLQNLIQERLMEKQGLLEALELFLKEKNLKTNIKMISLIKK